MFEFYQMKRREFARKTCPAFVLSIVGVALLESCDNTKEESVVIVPQEEKEYLDRIKSIGTAGFLQVQNKVYFNLKNGSYSKLLTALNFVNDLDNGVLLLRLSDTSLLAFDNCCPHLGSKNQWSFQSTKFKCANHGYSYGIELPQTANCSSGIQYGNLRSFKTLLYKDLLTVDFS
jgi:nitrite reductase/ring-hydroxylating ferredoxin subunit